MPESPKPLPPEEINAQKISQSYQIFFASEHGLNILRDLTTKFDHNQPSFIPPDYNSHHAALRDGQQMVINYILKRSTQKTNETDIR